MAGYWIKIEHLLPDKPEVYAIASTLAIDPDAVVGKLIRVWIWADQQLRSGCAPSVTLAALDRVTNQEGFGAAMEAAGWLVVTRKGILFPNFERHNGQTAKDRGLASIRMLRSRYADVTPGASPKSKRKSKKEEDPLSPSPNPSQNAAENGAPEAAPDGDPAGLALPAELAGEAFARAWGEWCRYRRERGQPLTPTGARALLGRLAKLGTAAACARIEDAIANGYQGLLFAEASNHAGAGAGENVGRSDPPGNKYAGVVEPIGGAGAAPGDE